MLAFGSGFSCPIYLATDGYKKQKKKTLSPNLIRHSLKVSSFNSQPR